MLAMPWWINWVRFCSYWYYSMALFFDMAVTPYATEQQVLDINTQYTFSQLSSGANVALMLIYILIFRLVAYVVLLTTKKLEFK